MNFLAHSFLSPKGHNLIQFGNMYGDFVKGNKFEGIHTDVIEGVKLHRSIDSYTDQHDITKELKALFRTDFGLFSGILVDMLYDHVLAKYWRNFHSEELSSYVMDLNIRFKQNTEFLPQNFSEVFQYMEQGEWMMKYQNLDGLTEILGQMSRRMNKGIELNKAIGLIVENEGVMTGLSMTFLEDVTDKYAIFK